jgi:pyruvate formate lyase activating enzyme
MADRNSGDTPSRSDGRGKRAIRVSKRSTDSDSNAASSSQVNKVQAGRPAKVRVKTGPRDKDDPGLKEGTKKRTVLVKGVGATGRGIREAMFQSPQGGGKVICGLCNHGCSLPPGRVGLCRVRKNTKGKLYTIIYGLASAVSVDPIEKKPFFHFHPGTQILSFGSVGCNYRCEYCQNYSISQEEIDVKGLKDLGPPDKPTVMAQEMGCRGIAWTYNEPTIWFEYVYEASKVAKKNGLRVVQVSNGYAKEAPLRQMAPYLDAINIDIKGFNKDRYRSASNAKLDHVLDTCRLVRDLGIHLEISYLLIPTHNDSREEITAFSRFVVDELGPDVPVHFLRYHPDYKWVHIPPTTLASMLKAYQTALREGLNYAYLGNITNDGYEDTRCPECDFAVISRKGHNVTKNRLVKGQCPECGGNIPVIG